MTFGNLTDLVNSIDACQGNFIETYCQLQPIGDQRFAHATHRVRCQIRVVFAKDMGDLFEPGIWGVGQAFEY